MQKHRKKLIKRILLFCAASIVIFLLISCTYIYVKLSRMKMNTESLEQLETLNPEPSTTTPIPEISYTPMPTTDVKLLQTHSPTAIPETNEGFGVTNIAIFGMDNRYKYTIIGGRSDVIMILTIDKRNNEVRVTSFIRDTLIYIDELNDYNRINAAIVYAKGPDGAVNCIEQEFGIAIDHYMVTNFVGMSRIIDAIGGVDVYVSSAIANDCNKQIKEMNSLLGYSTNSNLIKSSGNITLNGIQAVAFMRQRKREGGFARDTKQKTVLEAARQKLQNISIEQVNTLLNIVSDNVKTDMSPMELIQMTMYLYACKDGAYTTIRVPLDGTYKLAWYKKMSVVQYDKDSNQSKVYDFIYKDIDPYAANE